ncbi:hypothetical protein [Nocardia asteroides]|uniref:hypothetical protein n=1 Tax=Nocardia asteroides TaxID=1824 RepID=UPI001E5676A9|nr:hypothetical protein [Nocardia asteroides]UGT59152.1 hypothetical protein LTT61_17835 [Nocardia asteroides]
MANSPRLRPNPAPAHGTASREWFRRILARREFVLRQTVIDPGGSSGWHYHDGTLLVLVTRGTLDHPDARRTPIRYPRWRVFREPSGPRYPHVARNSGSEPVTIWVLYRNPPGAPLSRHVDPLD